MRLGIDFDNTLVCYDALFHRVALEGGWIPPDLPANKSEVRNHLRRIGREDVWTEMQGVVYGPRLSEATPFPGVLEFFRACRRAGIEVFIISHKTRTPFAGEPHNLHHAAWTWLESKGFFNPTGIGLPRTHVFLELTKQAKLQRIAACHCTHFIDDLPEFLAEPAFPVTAHRILFDPNRLYGPEVPFERLHHWADAPAQILGAATAALPHPAPETEQTTLLAQVAALLPNPSTAPLHLVPLTGGRNNRVYRIETATGDPACVLKRYFLNPRDPRDRFGAERAFYQRILARGIRRTPEPIAFDEAHRFALFRFLEGRKLRADEVDARHVDQAVAFITELNTPPDGPTAPDLPLASEACFTVAEHLDRIDIRVDRLSRIDPAGTLDREALSFVRESLVPAWTSIQNRIQAQAEPDHDTPLPPQRRCASPSDFGFHNALLAPDGTLRFLDFEYAGWDDPAKLVSDFFCQPEVPVDLRFWDRMVIPLGHALGWDTALDTRARLLFPAYRLKWCCILLNEFLRTDVSRRAFASDALAGDDRKAAQLAKARQSLATLTQSEGPT